MLQIKRGKKEVQYDCNIMRAVGDGDNVSWQRKHLVLF